MSALVVEITLSSVAPGPAMLNTEMAIPNLLTLAGGINTVVGPPAPVVVTSVTNCLVEVVDAVMFESSLTEFVPIVS